MGNDDRVGEFEGDKFLDEVEPFLDLARSKSNWDDFIKDPSIRVCAKINTAFKQLSHSLLADSFQPIEFDERRVVAVMMNARNYTDVRKWGKDLLDIVNEKHLLMMGIMGYIWGACIMVNSKVVPTNTVLVLSELKPETSGLGQIVVSEAAIIYLAQETFPNSQFLISYLDRMRELAGEVQSVMHKMEQTSSSMITTIEKV